MVSKRGGRFAGRTGDVLEAILTYSRDRIKLLNACGEIEYLNSSSEYALGVEDNADAIGRKWSEFWPEESHDTLAAALRAVFSGGSARFEGATTNALDGEERFWEVVVSPVRSESGEVMQALAISTDVTARRKALARGRRRLAKAESQVEFAAEVARELRHRLKNQLAVVNAVTKLLSRHSSDARELAQKLEEKLMALGRAQELLAVRREGPLTATQAVREVVAASGAGERIVVEEMPAVELPEESIQQLALLLSELQTNALKHGAFRSEAGRIVLTGSATDGILSLDWIEDCGQPVAPAADGNGGFQLIRRLGSVRGLQPAISWQPNGIAVQFHIRTS
ncbi:MAG: PAS domain-containing protein [Altererythrobacter sp.]|nr:PAS domain-containing protein [Altererythrobacter sp.]